MAKLLFTDGKVVTAEGSYRADVLVEDEKVVAVGTNLDANGAETVDAAGKLVMPGFIDAHTHMDMPFGGTVTADDWATGTEAAVAGGTTMLIDFSLQEEGGTLAGAVDAWTEKARGKAVIDYGFRVAITDLRDDIKAELPDLSARGVASVKIFMAYKGTPLYTEDDDLFETLQLSKEAGVLVMVHAENGDVIAKLQQQALEMAKPDIGPPQRILRLHWIELDLEGDILGNSTLDRKLDFPEGERGDAGLGRDVLRPRLKEELKTGRALMELACSER